METKFSSLEDQTRHISELLDRRRTGQARALLRVALAENPDDTELLMQGARADILDDNTDSARETLNQIIAQAPQHFGARAMLLMLLSDEGELVHAEQVALALISEYPQSPDLYAAYGRVMLRALLFVKARALAQEALHMDPENEFALRVLALCDLIDQPHRVDSAALRRLLAEHPEDWRTLSLVVTALIQRGDNRAALRGARELLTAQPDDPDRVTLVRELMVANHWSMIPLWPMQRYGWNASIGLWVGGVVAVRAMHSIAPDAVGLVSTIIIGYVIFSWVWPPLLKRWLMR